MLDAGCIAIALLAALLAGAGCFFLFQTRTAVVAERLRAKENELAQLSQQLAGAQAEERRSHERVLELERSLAEIQERLAVQLQRAK